MALAYLFKYHRENMVIVLSSGRLVRNTPRAGLGRDAEGDARAGHQAVAVGDRRAMAEQLLARAVRPDEAEAALVVPSEHRAGHGLVERSVHLCRRFPRRASGGRKVKHCAPTYVPGARSVRGSKWRATTSRVA